MVKTIPLTRGMVAIVDAADYECVSGLKWYAHPGANGVFYAVHKDNNAGRDIRMHRLLLDAENGELVDHRDWDGLNNRRKNLRKVTSSQNSQNRRLVKGYSWNKVRSRWEAQITVSRKQIRLGRFRTEALARAAYLNARKTYGFI